ELAVAVQAINRGNVRRYLRKPCPLDELRGEVRNAIDLYSLRSRAAAMERTLMSTGRVYALGLIAKSLGHELSAPPTQGNGAIAQARVQARLMKDNLSAVSNSTVARIRLDELDEWLRAAENATSRIVEMAHSMEMPASERGDDHADIAEVLRLSLRLV